MQAHAVQLGKYGLGHEPVGRAIGDHFTATQGCHPVAVTGRQVDVVQHQDHPHAQLATQAPNQGQGAI